MYQLILLFVLLVCCEVWSLECDLLDNGVLLLFFVVLLFIQYKSCWAFGLLVVMWEKLTAIQVQRLSIIIGWMCVAVCSRYVFSIFHQFTCLNSLNWLSWFGLVFYLLACWRIVISLLYLNELLDWCLKLAVRILLVSQCLVLYRTANI